jgi:hypothetical protein
VLRRTAPAGRITGASRSVEPLVGHVPIARCLPSDESAGRSVPGGGAHRTCALVAPNHTAGPTGGSAPPRPPYVDNDTRTSNPPFRRYLPRPTILRQDPGLAASPPVRYRLRREATRGISLPSPLSPAGTDKLPAKRRQQRHGIAANGRDAKRRSACVSAAHPDLSRSGRPGNRGVAGLAHLRPRDSGVAGRHACHISFQSGRTHPSRPYCPVQNAAPGRRLPRGSVATFRSGHRTLLCKGRSLVVFKFKSSKTTTRQQCRMFGLGGVDQPFGGVEGSAADS